MKKTVLLALILGIILMFKSPIMAKKEPGPVPQPQNLSCGEDTEVIGFDWDDVIGAVKYSLDVDVEVDSDSDGENDMTVEFSFSTVDSFLNVPITDFVYDIDGDGTDDQLSGPATAKVKGLDPGRGKKRQNNRFSETCDFTLP